MNNASTAPAAEKARPAYRQNPQPKQAYRITMTIDNAPGPFAHMLGLAQFDVVNPECLPPPKDNPGGHTSPIPTEGVEIPLQKVSVNAYSGVVYADQMLDEDYYGHGVCRWQLIQAQVQLKATGAEEEARFVPKISFEKILSEKTVTTFLAKEDYPQVSNIANYPAFGHTERSRYGANVRDEDLFTIELSARKEEL